MRVKADPGCVGSLKRHILVHYWWKWMAEGFRKAWCWALSACHLTLIDTGLAVVQALVHPGSCFSLPNDLFTGILEWLVIGMLQPYLVGFFVAMVSTKTWEDSPQNIIIWTCTVPTCLFVLFCFFTVKWFYWLAIIAKWVEQWSSHLVAELLSVPAPSWLALWHHLIVSASVQMSTTLVFCDLVTFMHYVQSGCITQANRQALTCVSPATQFCSM